jgi:hypothetical protein
MPTQQQNLLPGRNPEELVLTFAGNIVKHLGVQMYAGRPVPAIAELISNAWDADAKQVDVKLPLDAAWNSGNANQIIEVADNGNGMTWDMVRDAYLDVGRDRREEEKTDRSPGGRLLQGRKGVGKLAGFGIADIVEVQTVHKDKDTKIGDKVLLWFRLSLSDLKKAKRDPSPVDLIYAGPVMPTLASRSKRVAAKQRRLRNDEHQKAYYSHRSIRRLRRPVKGLAESWL